MKNHHPVPLFAILALALTASFSNAQDQQRSEEQLAQILKRFPEADTDKDGKLTTEEFQQFRQSMQGNARPAAAAQPPVIPDRVTLEKDIVYLVADPFETKNLAHNPAYLPKLEAMHAQLKADMETLNDAFSTVDPKDLKREKKAQAEQADRSDNKKRRLDRKNK